MAQAHDLKVGDGVSYGFGSDSYPATVIAVSKSGRKVTIQSDNSEYVKGTDQEFIYTKNPHGTIYEYSLRKNGQFCMVGTVPSYRGGSLGKGRRYYQDPSF